MENNISGKLLNEWNKGIADAYVLLSQVTGPGKMLPVAESKTDCNGGFSLAYKLLDPKNCGSTIWELVFRKDEKSTQYEVRYEFLNTEVNTGIEVHAEQKKWEGSEWSWYQSLFTTLAPDADFSKAETISWVHKMTGVGVVHIQAYATAVLLSKQLSVEKRYLYAWLRKGLKVSDKEILANNTLELLQEQLELAVSEFIIQDYQALWGAFMKVWNALKQFVADQNIEEVLKSSMGYEATLKDLLQIGAFTTVEQNQIAVFYHENQFRSDYWEALREQLNLSQVKYDKLKEVHVLNTILLGNTELIQAKLSEGSRALAIMPFVSWENLLSGQKDFLKKFPGETDAEKRSYYLNLIFEQLEQTHPMPFFHVRVSENNAFKHQNSFLKFLDANPQFEFGKQSVSSYIRKNKQALSGIDPEERTAFLRSLRLTQLQFICAAPGESTKAVSIMQNMELNSMSDVLHLGGSFVSAYVAAGGTEAGAQSILANAELLSSVLVQAYATYKDFLHLPWVLQNPVLRDLVADPELQQLFGSQDGCACKHCRSIYSPAAYLADALNFLERKELISGAQTLYQNLTKPERRSDIPELLLNCDNANTPMPYIDIVNEVLLNSISQGDKIIGVDTKRSAEELAAYPVFENKAALDTTLYNLKKAVYPFQLPFDYHRIIAEQWWKHIGTSPFELLKVFNHTNTSIEKMCKATFGITDTEWELITSYDETSEEERWGGTLPKTGKGNVKDWLSKTRLTLDEFTEVINTAYVQKENAPQIYYFKEVRAGIYNATCNLDEVEFAWYLKNNETLIRKDIDHKQRARVYTFIRLWQKLGWTVAQTDTLITYVFGGEIKNDTLKNLYYLAQLAEKWKCNIQDLLMLWSNQEKEYLSGRHLFYGNTGLSVFQVGDMTTWNVAAFKAPFTNPETTWEFVEKLEELRQGGFDYFELKYLLNPEDENVPEDILKKMPALKEEEIKKLVHLFLEHREKRGNLLEQHNVDNLISGLLPFAAIDFKEDDIIHLRNFLIAPIEMSASEDTEVTEESLFVNHYISGLEALTNSENIKLFRENSDLQTLITSEWEFVNYNYILHFIQNTFNLPVAGLYQLLGEEENGFGKILRKIQGDSLFKEIEDKLCQIHRTSILFAGLPNLQETFLPVYKALAADGFEINLGTLDLISQYTQLLKGYPNANEKNILTEIEAHNFGEGWQKRIINLFDWNVSIEQLEGLEVEDFRVEKPLQSFLNLQKLIQVVQKTQLPVAVLKVAEVNAGYVEVLQDAVKKNLTKEAWLKQCKTIYNPLRESLRNALVAFLIYKDSRFDSEEDLYRHFLLDTQMSSCMMTSRLLQAILSVQLFVQRCLMNLETGITTTESEDWKQWEWMKQYRVWEANRKVFAYPENWIEPELRDDKSPFFEELESELLQNEMTSELGEKAYLHYLQKLENVSNLEIMAMCRAYEDENDATQDSYYIFGRTYGLPQQLYFRKYVKSQTWTAWEKVEVDVEGDHLIPTVHNGKLHLFWPIFKEKAIKQIKNVPAAGEEIPEELMYWEFQMAWSVYENSKWKAKKLIKDIISEVDSTSGLDNLISFNILKFDIYQRKSRIFFYNDTSSSIKIFIPNDVENLKQYGTIYLSESSVAFKKGDLEVKNYNSISWNTNYFPARQFIEGGVVFVPISDINAFEYQRHTYHSNTLDLELINKTRQRLINFKAGLEDYKVISFKGESPITIWRNNKFIYNDQYNAILIERLKTSILKKDYKLTYLNSNVIIQKFEGRIESFIKNLTNTSLRTVGDQSIYNLDDKVFPGDVTGELLFTSKEANSLYNWELFFHIPIYIAGQLSKNNRYEEARKWYHYIFNPTINSADYTAARYWLFTPFKETYDREINSARRPLNIIEILRLLQVTDNTQNTDDYITNTTYEVEAQIEDWRNNPFEPHRIARLRVGAYMKNVVMKYIDNLIAWGDELFRQDTMESNNEATQLYMLAWEILGGKPYKVPSPDSKDYSYAELRAMRGGDESAFDEFGNVMVILEERIQVNVIRQFLPLRVNQKLPSSSNKKLPGSYLPSRISNKLVVPRESASIRFKNLYFCIPENEKLTKYWDTVADRFFKLRNCMNIDGTIRQLPLYQPPIDPALLVRAKAMGLSIAEVLNDINAPVAHYRFQYMIAKAVEYTQEVKALAGAFLSALQSKDAEEMALLRARHEINMMDAMRQIRKDNIQLAKEAVTSMELSKEMTENRLQYYRSKPKMTPEEKTSFYLKEDNHTISIASQSVRSLASVQAILPQFKIGPFNFGTELGGLQISNSLNAAASVLDMIAQANNNIISSSLERSSINLRWEEWKHQEQQAQIELKRIEKELLSAEIRLALAEKEAENHELQLEQNNEQLEFMKSRFTNLQLYNWMSGELTKLYRQSFEMAYQLAKKAEKNWQYELGEEGQFIKYGHWDSLYKGLLAGEKLMADLRRMETAYLDKNKREYELIKHISLAQLDPLALIMLRETSSCEFTIPEVLYDLDHSGHYFRRIKSVSISIPCIAGPYTSVSAKLSQTGSKYRKSIEGEYPEQLENDERFVHNFGARQSVATSHAQNDSGMFELNFRDERYLPFENTGAISSWELELPKEIKQFDHTTISDVIVHVKYTARDGGTNLKKAADAALKDQLALIEQELKQKGLHSAINMKQDMPNEWHLLKKNGKVSLKVEKSRLPYIAQEARIESVMFVPKIAGKDNTGELPIDLMIKEKDKKDFKIKNISKLDDMISGKHSDIELDQSFILSVSEDDKLKLEELLLVVNYKL